MKRKLLSLIIGCLLFSPVAFAQTGTLTGTVTDQQSGEVLPGVNIYIPDLERGAATNAKGVYSIQDIEFGTYLVRATYVGFSQFEQEVNIDQETTTLDIALASQMQQLEDVVVTAYGVEQSMNELPYSAQQANVEDVTQTRSSNFLTGLNGRIAGLKINQSNTLGGSTNIVMRGYKSVTGGNQVLFVVDGVPYSNHDFNNEDVEEGFAGYDYGNTAVDINPDNIKSINVLKGPAAAALYGSRASNGAIIIETKKGTPGQRVQVTLNSSVSISQVDPETFIEYQELYGQGYVPVFASEDVDGDGTADVTAYTEDDASFGPRFDSNLMVYQWDAFSGNHPNFQTPTQWTVAENMPIDFFETGINATNSISIQGGFEGGYYNLGYNQSNTEGVLPNSHLDNYKLNFASGYDISDKLNVDASIQYSRTDAKGRPETGYSTIMSEFRQWWATNVDIVDQRRAYFRDRTNESWNWGSGRDFPIYWNNPYWDRYENFQEDRRDRYFGYAEASYDLLDWLSLSGRIGIDSYDMLIEERANKGGVASGATPSGEIRFDVPYYLQTKENFTEFTYDLLANYNIQPTEQISLSGIVGAAITRNKRQMTSAFTNGGLVVPGLYSIDNSLNQIQFPEEIEQQVGINGFFASANLNYDDFITLQLTGRRDKSSSLPEDENVYYYPSASLGIIFTRFLDVDWLSFGKIRGSWAEVGNAAPPHSILDTFERETNFSGAGLYTLPDTKNKSDLKPERTKSWEVGLQMRFLNDRLSYDLNYYDQNTLNQILATEVSRAAGYAFKFVNAGNVENRGIELTVAARPVEMQRFTWNITFNWNRNLNEVKELAPGIDNYQLASPQGDVTISAALGEPYGALRGSDYISSIDANNDGILNDPWSESGGQRVVGSNGFYLRTTSANHIIGNMNPDWTGGVGNEINFKNWSLNFLVDVRWGGDVFSLDQYYGQGTGLYPVTASVNDRGNNVRDPVSEGGGVILDGVKEDGSPNDIYAPAENYAGAFGWINNPSAHFVYDGSYIKLREVGLTYNLPQTFIDRIGGISGASVSVVGRNLWVIHKNLPFADPEQGLVAGNVQGYQGAVHPSTRDFTFNLKLEF